MVISPSSHSTLAFRMINRGRVSSHTLSTPGGHHLNTLLVGVATGEPACFLVRLFAYENSASSLVSYENGDQLWSSLQLLGFLVLPGLVKTHVGPSCCSTHSRHAWTRPRGGLLTHSGSAEATHRIVALPLSSPIRPGRAVPSRVESGPHPSDPIIFSWSCHGNHK